MQSHVNNTTDFFSSIVMICWTIDYQKWCLSLCMIIKNSFILSWKKIIPTYWLHWWIWVFKKSFGWRNWNIQKTWFTTWTSSCCFNIYSTTSYVLAGVIQGKEVTKVVDEFVKKSLSEVHGFIQEYVTYCKNKGVKANYKVVTENPDKEILDQSKKIKVI